LVFIFFVSCYFLLFILLPYLTFMFHFSFGLLRAWAGGLAALLPHSHFKHYWCTKKS